MNITFSNVMKMLTKTLKENYMNFTGRISKNDYWNFMVGATAIFIIINGILSFLYGGFFLWNWCIGAGQFVLNMLLFIPVLGVNLRRCHDLNHDDMYLAKKMIICCIGWYQYFVEMAKDGNAGENSYGPAPESICG